MRIKKSKRPFTVVLVFANDVTRSVTVQATSREVAETRALKRNPNATGVKRNA